MFKNKLYPGLRVAGLAAALLFPSLAWCAASTAHIAKNDVKSAEPASATKESVKPEQHTDARPLSEYGVSGMVLEAQNHRLQDDLDKLYQERRDLNSKLSELQKVQDALKAAAEENAQPPVSDEQKMAYVAGLSLTSGIQGRLDSWTALGIKVDSVWLDKGLRDGLDSRQSLKPEEVDSAWQSFSSLIQIAVDEEMKAGKESIIKKLNGRTPALEKNGMTFLVLKKGKPVDDKNTPVKLALREQILGGRVVSEVPSLILSSEDEMPAVVRNALPLLGAGGSVTAYALAKSVYGQLPLPTDVQPFTVLEYRITRL